MRRVVRSDMSGLRRTKPMYHLVPGCQPLTIPCSSLNLDASSFNDCGVTGKPKHEGSKIEQLLLTYTHCGTNFSFSNLRKNQTFGIDIRNFRLI